MQSFMKLKEDLAGKEKLKEMAQCDLRTPQNYVSWRVEESRMAFRLQTRLLDCRANMPTKYRRDLVCSAGPTDQILPQGWRARRKMMSIYKVCPGYGELWQGLGPLTPRSRVRYLIKLISKRLKLPVK